MAVHKSHQIKEEALTARCDTHVKEILYLLSRSERLPMSDVIVKSILEYHQRHFPTQSFFSKEQELFGRYGSAKGDLSVRRKQYLKGIVSGKHCRN